MTDEEKTPEELAASKNLDDELRAEFANIQREISGLVTDLSQEEIAQIEDVYYLWICWGDFHLYITHPYIEEQLPPTIIKPGYNTKTKSHEFVYPIADYGNRFSTSPGEELMAGGRATGKLLNTVEKIISLAIARAKQEGGATEREQIRVAFLGVDVAQRKAYKLCLDAQENVFVTNFEPGEWSERIIKTTKELIERGYTPIPTKF